MREGEGERSTGVGGTTPTGGTARPASAPADPLGVLRGLDLLRGVDEASLAALADRVHWCRLLAGDELFAEGAEAQDGMYVVAQGRLECTVDGAVVREVPRGETVGELALLLDQRRSATVRAVRDSLLVRLDREDLDGLFHRGPVAALELTRLIARRAVTGPVGSGGAGLRSVALVSLDPRHPVESLADRVERRLAAVSDTVRVDAATLSTLAADGAEAVVARLAEEEGRHDTVVVTVPPAAANGPERELTATVLRQMDLVLLVARAGGVVDRATLAAVGSARRPVSVAILHPAGASPRATAELTRTVESVAEVRDHVHLVEDSDDDLGRLARILSGHAVGLVLGGGGSRGFTHIGVVRALRETGLPFDRVGGSSMGAVMGAQVALGWSPEEMVERNAAVWSRRRLVELGLPTLSLLRGRRALHMFDSLFGDVRIEDLFLDYFCTTVDLSNFRLHVARLGGVADWTRASATVPGLWPPLVDEHGHLHADGGVLDNVPTDLMRSANVGSVIGVDVCNRQSPMRVDGPADLPNGIRLIRERRHRWVPTILDVLNRANLLASLQTHQHSERHADLFFAPPVEDQGFAAFDRIRDLADFGYRDTVDRLEEADLSVFRPAIALAAG